MGISGEPQRQDDLEALRAGEIGGHPDLFKGFEDRWLRVERSSSAFFELGFDKTFESSQQSDRMFSVVTAVQAEFVENDGFFFNRCFLVS